MSLGKGWKPVVWENLGWHSKVKKGNVEVYASTNHFMAGTDGRGILGEGKTAAEALMALLKRVLAERAEVETCLEDLRSVVAGCPKHPRYQAKRPPRGDCSFCWTAYRKAMVK